MFINIYTFAGTGATFSRMKETAPASLNPTLWRTCKMLAGTKRIHLLRQLHERPGQSVKALGEAIGVKRSDASQELRRIQSRGLLKSKRQGIPLIYRLEADPQVPSAAPLLKALQAALTAYPPKYDAAISHIAKGLANERRIAIARALIARPGASGNLQRQLDLSRSALAQHLHVLAKSGFAIRHDGRYYFTTPPHPVARALVRLLQQNR